VNAAVNWRANLAPEKLNCADFVHNPPNIMALMQNHDMPEITVFMIFLQPEVSAVRTPAKKMSE